MLIFGAGNIGRGFIGDLFSASGFSLVFADVDRRIVSLLNETEQYSIAYVNGAHETVGTVRGVRAVDAGDRGAVIRGILGADILATAVGVHNLARVAPALAEGFLARRDADRPPVNVLVCENKIGANRILQEMVASGMPGEAVSWLDRRVGFVETSIGRMVPMPEPGAADPLLIRVEPYSYLPYDARCWRGDRIAFSGGVPCDGFVYQIKKKLFLHNMAHAVAGYLGYQKGYAYIHEAMADAEIRGAVRDAMDESARALRALYPDESAGISADADGLMERFQNTGLRDPVARVCADPLRKLSPEDRLVGALRACEEAGIECPAIWRGIRAALTYDAPEDASALRMRQWIARVGVDAFLSEHAGLEV
ncbi:MAG: mannitol dehydrogenase [Clostridia bacterium]|nr:mannitol dehydrogenase [Clostridia bacterium]